MDKLGFRWMLQSQQTHLSQRLHRHQQRSPRIPSPGPMTSIAAMDQHGSGSQIRAVVAGIAGLGWAEHDQSQRRDQTGRSEHVERLPLLRIEPHAVRGRAERAR